MNLSSFLSTTGAKVLSRTDQRSVIGGVLPIANCQAECYGGGKVSCNGSGTCESHDYTGSKPSENGYCISGSDRINC